MPEIIPEDWTVKLSESQKDFELTHNPCESTYSGGADSPENAQSMIINNQTNHECSV